MTVIVYRDGVMAADSLVTDSWCRLGTTVKIVRSPSGLLAGACGESEDCHSFLEWIKVGGPKDTIPKLENKDGDFNAFVVDGERRVWMMGANLIPCPLMTDFYAIGGGASFAVGAMEMGASAIDAVNVAIKYHGGCGLPVRFEAL